MSDRAVQDYFNKQRGINVDIQSRHLQGAVAEYVKPSVITQLAKIGFTIFGIYTACVFAGHISEVKAVRNSPTGENTRSRIERSLAAKCRGDITALDPVNRLHLKTRCDSWAEGESYKIIEQRANKAQYGGTLL